MIKYQACNRRGEKIIETINHNLSILIFAYGLMKNTSSYGDSPKGLLLYCKKNFKNTENLTRKEFSKKTFFEEEENEIIEKSLSISQYVTKKQLLNLSIPTIEILSLNDKNTIGDIKVNDNIFNLNLNAMNLGNLDISRFLFLFTKSNKYTNKNVFEVFAKEELERLFRKGCDILIDELSKKSYEAKLTKVSYSKSIDKLYFFYQGQEFYVDDFSSVSYTNFFKVLPTSYLKVFSDCFNERVKYTKEYKEIKNNCLSKVKKEIQKIIENKPENFSMNNLVYSLLKLTNNSYYSMSLSNDDIECYLVPSRNEFCEKFEVSSIKIEVQDGELDIKLLILEKNKNKHFELNNILDYQNGEFYNLPKLKTNIDKNLIHNIYQKK